ncbi:MAG: ribosome biogenesis GTPase Der [Holosporales bacterium]|jgi:GTP-binding protein|nr:ribosome biogenesis GTPase Der [Holosporales bacterium]
MNVTLIGRANVGKSTLFNRLIGRREALVHDTPGVTRDCHEGVAYLGENSFRVWDTAGIEADKIPSLAHTLNKQTLYALQKAQIVLFIVDVQSSLLPADFFVAKWLRKHLASEQRVQLVANKAENRSYGIASLAAEVLTLGFGEALFISAEHNIGTKDLYDILQKHLFPSDSPIVSVENPSIGQSSAQSAPMRIAIIGRPNVGKSTLVNAVLQEHRVLTGATAGLTRDAIRVQWSYKGQMFELVDTAGQRRRARITDPLELLATSKAQHATVAADIACLVLDATLHIEKQDLTLGRRVFDKGSPLIIVLNKWDAITFPKGVLKAAQEVISQGLSQVKGIPVVAVSAQNGTNLQEVFFYCLKLHQRAETTFKTAELNRWLQRVVQHYPPPTHKGKQTHLKYMTQTGKNPLAFLMMGTRTEAIPDAYRRYLLNGLVDTFHLTGIPIKITFRQTRNPYNAP